MVTIERKVFENIMNTLGKCMCEAGGIIGGIKETDVTEFVFDGETSENEYIPNVDKLNNTIAEWSERNIYFLGIIHSHITRKELSTADIIYARNIIKLNKMHRILMPIFVLNTKELYVYIVTCKEISLVLKQDLCDQ